MKPLKLVLVQSTMNDIVDTICAHLRTDICPVYWPEDAAEDEVALMAATGLANGAPERRIGGGVANHVTSASICTYDTFRRLAPSLPQRGKTASGQPRVDARALRRGVLGEFGGNVVRWLVATIKRETSIQVPMWYARAFLPLPHKDAVAAWQIAKLWQGIEGLGKSAVKEDIASMIITKRRAGLMNMSSQDSILDDLVDCAGTEAVRERCAAILNGDSGYSNLAWSLKLSESAFHAGAPARARMVAEACRPVHGWVPYPEDHDMCLSYIMVGESTDICDRLSISRKAALEDKAKEFEVDLGQLRQDLEAAALCFFEMAEETDDDHIIIANLSRMVDDTYDFGSRGMVINAWLADYEDREVLPHIVTHTASGLTTNHPFMYNDCTHTDADELQEEFDRLQELRAEMDERGLIDSRMEFECVDLGQAFVVHGKYCGPTRDTSREPVELVVDMMVEMTKKKST